MTPSDTQTRGKLRVEGEEWEGWEEGGGEGQEEREGGREGGVKMVGSPYQN